MSAPNEKMSDCVPISGVAGHVLLRGRIADRHCDDARSGAGVVFGAHDAEISDLGNFFAGCAGDQHVGWF